MITVHIAKKYKDIDVNSDKLKKLARSLCKRFEITNAAINIVIATDNQIRQVNKEFLNCPDPTDVISFDLSETGSEEKTFDIMVNGQMAKEQAKQRGHNGEAELALYITHGLLHNLGFDDSTEKQAKEMHQLEDEILKQHRFGTVYHS